MSKRCLRTSGCFKEEHLTGVDGLPEVGVPDGTRFDQVHRTLQEGLEIFLQPEVVPSVLGGNHLLELHQHVDVTAGGIETLAGRGADER